MILAIGCGACVLVLLWAEAADKQAVRAVAKTLASAAFVALGFCRHSPTTFGAWICAGLVLGALGDVALLGRGSKWFLAGLGLFLAGHIAYVVAIAEVESPARWYFGPLALAPIAAGVAALAYLWPRLGAMRGPVIGYVAAIAAMVIGSLAAQRAGRVPPRFAVGACLFFLSDLAVARDKFVSPTVWNKLWGLPCYYAAQLLIASSL